MTINDALAGVKAIEADMGDPEAAHESEDALRERFLKAVAAGTCEHPKEVAEILLRTTDLDFPRWCA